MAVEVTCLGSGLAVAAIFHGIPSGAADRTILAICDSLIAIQEAFLLIPRCGASWVCCVIDQPGTLRLKVGACVPCVIVTDTIAGVTQQTRVDVLNSSTHFTMNLLL